MKFALDIYAERFSPDIGYEQLFAETLELVKMADKGGFDIAFTAEHHTLELHISPNPLTTLVYWGAHTSRIRLGTAIVTAPYWHPIRLAGEAAMADILTAGRLELGLGRGAYQYEFNRMADGIEQTKGGDYLREIVPLLRELWQGDVEHSGKFWSFPRATAVPKPVQKPHPQLWIAARGQPTFDFAIENRCNVLANPFNRPFSEVVDLKKRFDDAVKRYAAKENGVPYQPKLLILRRVCVYENERDCSTAIEKLQTYGARFENLFHNTEQVRNGFADPMSLDEIANKDDYDPDILRTNLLFGTPRQVIEKIGQYADLGIDYLAYGASYGLPADLSRQSLKLFIDEVMPKFAKRKH